MRSIWKGFIAFGLVNIPVKLYSATEENRITFDLLHEKDLSPIRYARICKVEGEEVPYDQIVKGYEYEKEQYVVLDSDDFKRANVRESSSITILDFASLAEIDPIYFEKPYYLEPEKGAEKSYALLSKSLQRLERVGVGKFVLRNREHLVTLIAKDSALVLEQLRFSDQIRPNELRVPKVEKISDQEFEIAEILIKQLSRKFEPSDYVDTYEHEIERVINDKIAGRVPAVKGEAPRPTPVPDLVEMLRKSLEEEKKKKIKAGAR